MTNKRRQPIRGRVSDEELEASVSQINKSKPSEELESSVKTVEPKNEFYNSTGELVDPNVDDDAHQEDVFASRQGTHGNYRYKVAINRRNTLRNPHDRRLHEESVRLGRQTGQPPYLLVETTDIGFAAYLKFLKENDSTELRLAQRKIK